MLMTFLFPLAHFFQPGVFWPAIAPYKPMQVLAVLAILLSIGRKVEYNRRDALLHPAVKWIAAFLLIQVASVYRAGLGTVISEFLFWMVYPLFIFVTVRLVTGELMLRRYIWGVLVGSIWIVAYGMYAAFSGLNELAGNRAGAYGMYENHNDYTFIILMILPFAHMFWRAEKSRFKRLLLGGSVLTCIAGVFVSLSRGGMLALVLEIVLIVMLTMTRRQKFILLPLVLAVGVAAVGYQYVKRAENQGDHYTAADAESSRYELWRAGGAMVKAHPFLGTGSRTFGEFARFYIEMSKDQIGKNAHNTYVDIAATSGLLGFFTFALMLRAMWRELRRPISEQASPWLRAVRQATLIAISTIFFRAMLDVKTVDWSFYFLIAVAALSAAILKAQEAAAATTVVEPEPPKPPPNRPRSNRIVD